MGPVQHVRSPPVQFMPCSQIHTTLFFSTLVSNMSGLNVHEIMHTTTAIFMSDATLQPW